MDTGSRPIMTYGEPAITGGSPRRKNSQARQMVRAVLSVHDRSEPPSGPILGNRPQRAHPGHGPYPDLPAHHLASAYKFSDSTGLQVGGF